MYQQPSRQPRQTQSNMQQRGGNLPQQPRQPPQQQQQQQMGMPMVPPMNQQQYPQVYPPYQTTPMYPYAMNQYPPQFVAMMPQAPGMMTQPQMSMPMGQQPRYQPPMAAPNRLLQPRQPHVPHQKNRPRAIPIVDPNTLQEVSLVNEASNAEDGADPQVNGEEELPADSVKSQPDLLDDDLPNGSEEESKTDERLTLEYLTEPEEEKSDAQESKTADISQPSGSSAAPEQSVAPSSKPVQESQPEETKWPNLTPEPDSSKSPEPNPPAGELPPSTEPMEAEDEGDWQEAKVRSKKKKAETRPVLEKQPERQQRRKDFDKKGPKGKTTPAGTSKAERTPEPPATPTPPPVLSYKDRLLGKKEARKAPDASTERKSEEKEVLEQPPKVESKEDPEEIAPVAQEDVVVHKEEAVAEEEEMKPDVKSVKIDSEEVRAQVEQSNPEVVQEESKLQPKEEVSAVIDNAQKEEVMVEENIETQIGKEEEEKPQPEIAKEEIAAVEVPQIEVESETPSPVPEPEEPAAKPVQPEEKTATKLKRSSSMDDLVYADDQWSPRNQQGKKKYESDFLRKLQTVSVAMKLPENITLPKNIVREANRDFRPVGGGSTFLHSKENLLMPSFAGSFSPKRDPRRMADGTPRVIKSISLSADVKLNESENAWRPNKRKVEMDEAEKSDLEDLLKKVRSIINKITPEKFDKLMGQVKDMKIDTKEKLEGVINLVFLKAIDEPNFSHVYAKMCHELSTYVRLKTDEEGQTVISFKRLLISRCQQEYERQLTDDYAAKREEELKKIEAAEGDDKKELQLRLEEMDRKKRVRYVGVNRFIAELYQLSLLTHMIIFRCINELLDEQSEECLECMCKIVTTIGQDLEGKGVSLEKPMQKVKELITKKVTGTRIRFMMQDVVELRENKWKPRREIAKPKTMEEIAQEAKREAAIVPPPSPMPQSTPNHRGGTPGRGIDRGNDRMGGRGTPRMPKVSNTPFDAKKLSGLSMSMNAEVSLGRPSFGQWQTGSGGGVANSKDPINRRSTNMFMVLDDDKSTDLDGPNNNYSKPKQPPRM